MVKAVVMVNGRPLTIFGLSGENITRLVAGEPIRIHGGDIRLPGSEFVIMYGRTEQDINEEIEKTLRAGGR